MEKVRAKIEKSLVLGNGMDEKVNQGPLINENQFKKVCSLVDDAKTKGAGVILGGASENKLGSLFYKPTILTDIKPSMEIASEEIFGPVIATVKFKTEEVMIFFRKVAKTQFFKGFLDVFLTRGKVSKNK